MLPREVDESRVELVLELKSGPEHICDRELKLCLYESRRHIDQRGLLSSNHDPCFYSLLSIHVSLDSQKQGALIGWVEQIVFIVRLVRCL